jgi:hypothetical protein
MNLATIPLETEQGAPLRVRVTSLPSGEWTLAWGRNGGLTVEPFGDPFASVREACRAAARINERAE